MNIYILSILLAISVYFDYRFRRIPNKVTFPVIIIGIIYWVVTRSAEGLIISLLGILTGFLVFIIPYIAQGIGAGDVKLMMAIGALLGWKVTFVAALFTALVGGVISVGYIIFHKDGRLVRISLFKIIVVPILKKLFFITGNNKFMNWQFKYSEIEINKSNKYIPYAIPISIGTIVALSGLFEGIINF